MAQNKPFNPGKIRSHGLTTHIRSELRILRRQQEAEIQSGRTDGYLNQKLKKGRDGDLLVSEFLTYSDFLGKDPGEVLREAGVSNLDLRDKSGIDGDDNLPGLLVGVPEFDGELKLIEHIEKGVGRDATKEDLQAIEELRHRDPIAAYNQLFELSAGEWAPYVLGIAASCFRAAGMHQHATRLLIEGWLYSPSDDHLMRGQIYQRASYLLENLGLHKKAVSATLLANGMFSLADDRMKVGESIIDRARCHGSVDGHRQAIDLLNAAKKYEKSLNARNRFALHQMLSVSLLKMNQIEEAREELAAAPPVSGLGPVFHGKTLWLAGAISYQRGRTKEGKKLYLEALELLQDSPVDLLLCGAQLAGELAQGGNAYDIRRLAEKLANTKFVEVPAMHQAILKIRLAEVSSTLREAANKEARADRLRLSAQLKNQHI